MRKILLIILFIGIILSIQKVQKKEEKSQEEIRGVFISYIEISKYLQDLEEKKSKQKIIEMIENVKEKNLNTIILQVRPACDAIYNSKIFPVSTYLSSSNTYSYDVLEFFLEESHKRNVKLIAWINPYRIKTNDKVEELSPSSPAYPYIDTDIIYIKNGIYWNPSKEETLNNIIEGVKEVLNYEIDGLIFDDYFYPDDEIDKIDYIEYQKSNPNVSLEEYHLEKVNHMIKQVYLECHKKNVQFGVAPEGNMENNYQKNYADVKRWLKEDNYIDFIMPQLYYGFYNSTKPYLNTLEEWSSLIENQKIQLLPALAIYKSGSLDQYAKEGKEEWVNNQNIIMRQVLLSRNQKQYAGFSLFRYGNIFDEEINKFGKLEMYNLQKILK